MVELLRFSANESQLCTIVRNLRRIFVGIWPLAEQHPTYCAWSSNTTILGFKRTRLRWNICLGHNPQDIWTIVKYLSSKFRVFLSLQHSNLNSLSSFIIVIKSFGWVTYLFIHHRSVTARQSPILLSDVIMLHRVGITGTAMPFIKTKRRYSNEHTSVFGCSGNIGFYPSKLYVSRFWLTIFLRHKNVFTSFV